MSIDEHCDALAAEADTYSHDPERVEAAHRHIETVRMHLAELAAAVTRATA